ncbi:MAG: family 16 glycoside hydrolase [Kiritimatiellia bacterium]
MSVLSGLVGVCLALSAHAAEIDPSRSRALLETLQSADASFYEKARACQQAGEFGTAVLVPELAELLSDGKLSDYARSGLENIPGPEGAAALRSALSTVKGGMLKGVINSLGTLRDVKSAPALRKFAADPEGGVRREALLALGMIADKNSVETLSASLKCSSSEVREAAASACFLAAEQKIKAGKFQEAKKLYEAVSSADLPKKGFRQGCVAGSILASKPEGADYLVEQLISPEADVRKAARFAADEFCDDDVKAALAKALNKSSDKVACRIQEALSCLYYKLLIPKRRFNGWEGDTKKSFRREDDAIVGGTLKEAIPRNEFLATTREYTNFILRAECKIIGEKCNAGIQIRTQRIPDHHEVKGYQADISADENGGYWGKLYDESRRKKILGESLNRAEMVKTLKPHDWNQYEIRCQGKRIQLFVNGVKTLDYIEQDDSIPQFGIIALQVHAGPPCEAWYRNIRIVELP